MTPIRREYESVAALTTPGARAAYVAEYLNARDGWPVAAAADVAAIIKGLDARGAWVTNSVRVHETQQAAMHSGETVPIRGISTGVFVRNLGALTAYVAGLGR